MCRRCRFQLPWPRSHQYRTGTGTPQTCRTSIKSSAIVPKLNIVDTNTVVAVTSALLRYFVAKMRALTALSIPASAIRTDRSRPSTPSNRVSPHPNNGGMVNLSAFNKGESPPKWCSRMRDILFPTSTVAPESPRRLIGRRPGTRSRANQLMLFIGT